VTGKLVPDGNRLESITPPFSASLNPSYDIRAIRQIKSIPRAVGTATDRQPNAFIPEWFIQRTTGSEIRIEHRTRVGSIEGGLRGRAPGKPRRMPPRTLHGYLLFAAVLMPSGLIYCPRWPSFTLSGMEMTTGRTGTGTGTAMGIRT
jgi:hypothetical protein